MLWASRRAHEVSANPLPDWFEGPQREVRAALAGGRLAHGILIHEDSGAGGLEFARWIAQLVNCREPARAPCGECQHCRWVAADQHPDVMRLSPIEDSNYILVEQVRALIAELALTAHGSGYKVAILAPADALFANAANSLLKTLEEPPPRTLILLATSQPARLMATVRSRCSRIRLRGPDAVQAARFLEASRGAGPWKEALAATGGGPFSLLDADPEALAKLRSDTIQTLNEIGSGKLQPPGVAERWTAKGSDIAGRLACLEIWVTQRILETASIRDVTHLSGQGGQSNICRLFELSDAVREMRKLSLTSINKTMAVESLLWRWARQ
jgi:DNA polymerase-3 subunit delta'